jgi:phosphocarrier protein
MASGLPVRIRKEGIPSVDARSLLEVMTADFGHGCEVELSILPEALPAGYRAADAAQALESLSHLLEAATAA